MKCLAVIPLALCALASTGQTGRTVNANPQEFPATLSQTVEAGKTAAGTAVSARLMMATLVNGVVVPEGATLNGVVEVSAGRSESQPARIKIRMTQAIWKERAIALNLYLADQYYPRRAEQAPADSPLDSRDSTMRDVLVSTNSILTRGGLVARSPVTDPDTNTKAPPTRHADQNAANDASNSAPARGMSGRTKLDRITAVPDGEGGIALVSDLKKLKLDRGTCYSFESVTVKTQPGSHAAK